MLNALDTVKAYFDALVKRDAETLIAMMLPAAHYVKIGTDSGEVVEGIDGIAAYYRNHVVSTEDFSIKFIRYTLLLVCLYLSFEEISLNISVISFDGDMTLWDFYKVMRHSLKQTLTELQRQVPTQRALELTIDEMIWIRDQYVNEVKGEIWNLLEIRRGAFEQTLEYVGYPNKKLAAHLNAIYRKHRFEDIELYSDVIPTFDVLTQHYKLGLLSNGNTYPERCGLEDYFSFVIFAQDVQVEKPDPKIFEITAQQAGCEFSQLMHVGDSLENDVAGANNVGAHAVWLNREGIQNNTDTQPNYEISSLTEIPTILGL